MTIYFIIILVLIAAITFFHWLQGVFSATISAIIAVIAATVAIGFHEKLVFSFLAGKFADTAHAMSMLVIFAVVYIVLRVIFDKAIPGNVRVPAIAEKVGGGVMGLIVAFFATGVMTVAANSLPFGPTIAGYARFKLLDSRSVVVPTGGQMKDADVNEELRSDRIDPTEGFLENDRTSLLIPVDDIVIGTVEHLSDGGSLAGSVPFSAIHPNYNDELFGQRLGVQLGAKRVAINNNSSEYVKLPAGDALFYLKSVDQYDPEFSTFRKRNLPGTITPSPAQMLLVVRTFFDKIGTDSDFTFRVSPASVRLVGNRKNYFPIGVLDSGNALFNNKLDDFLFISLADKDRGADFVFLVDKSDVTDEGSAPTPKLRDGVFLEVKRMGRINLGGKEVSPDIVVNADAQVSRHPEKFHEQAAKYSATKYKAPAPGVKTTAAPTALESASKENDYVAFDKPSVSTALFSPVGITVPDENAASVTFPGGTGAIKGKKWESIEVKPQVPISELGDADYRISDFAVPAGMKMVQLAFTPSTKSKDPWAWADKVGDFEISDDAGHKYKPKGVIAKVKHEAKDKMVAKYSTEGSVATLAKTEGRPTDLWILYIVPENSTIRGLSFGGAPFLLLNVEVK